MFGCQYVTRFLDTKLNIFTLKSEPFMHQNTSTIGNSFWASKLWWLHKMNDLVIQDYMSSHLEWNCTTCYFISHLTWPSKGRAVRPGTHWLLSLGRWPWRGWTTREASGTSWWRFLSSSVHLHGSLRRLKIFKLINWLVNFIGCSGTSYADSEREMSSLVRKDQIFFTEGSAFKDDLY